MTPRLPWLLFLPSLALNLLFLGGAYWASQEEAPRPGPAGRLERAAERLGLSPEQKNGLDSFVRSTHDRMSQLRQSNENLIQAAIEEVANPQMDRVALNRILDALTAKRREFMDQTSAELHDFLMKLSPEQRAAALAALEERHETASPSLFHRLFPPPPLPPP